MAKKPTAANMASLDIGEATKETVQKPRSFHEQPITPGGSHDAVKTDATEKKFNVREDAKALTVYLTPEDHTRLKVLAVQSGSSIQNLFMDGIDTVLKKHGEQPVTRWKTKRS